MVVKGVGGPANKEVIADKNKTISQYFAEQYKCHLKCVFIFFSSLLNVMSKSKCCKLVCFQQF